MSCRIALMIRALFLILPEMSVLVRYQTWLAVIFSIFILAAYSLYIQPWMFDDAFIYFRYAENFLEGNGLVYNVGERVEGYTSFLWLMLMTAGKWLGLNVVIWSKLAGLAFALGCLILLANSHRFVVELDTRTSTTATVIMGTSGIFLPWGVSGAELTLFTFLVLLATLYYLYIRGRDSPGKIAAVGAFCGLAALARPEGIMIFTVMAVDQLIIFVRSRKCRLGWLVISFAVIYLPFFCWRYSYYGYPLPNTYYAKVEWGLNQLLRGCRYLAKFGVPALAALLPLFDPGVLLKLKRKFRRPSLLFIVPIIYAGYIVAVGGDFMPAARFFTPVLPLICILSAAAIGQIFRGKTAAWYLAVVVAYNILVLDFYYINGQIKHSDVANLGKEAGLWLKDHARPDAVIATNTAGSIAYYSGLTVIDMLGLTDPIIAHRPVAGMGKGYAGHERTDGEYILSRRPDYVQFWSSLGSADPIFASDKEIYAIPEFHESYELGKFVLPSGRELILYVRRPAPGREAGD